MQVTLEANFDGLVGPTHNFAGLAAGNLASWQHRQQVSNPKAAALQGLAKMERLAALGVPQAVLPPQPRPDIALLRRLGFAGTESAILAAARRETPGLLAIAASGSSMWTANAATVGPSADTADRRVHFTPANLATNLHRAWESETTARVLKRIFNSPEHFVHHPPLPAAADFGDEGAANHTRFCDAFDSPGVQLFVYGGEKASGRTSQPTRFPARQSRAACESVARLHRLNPHRVVFAKQHPAAIDAGVFHNDVIAVGHRQLLFCHQDAFEHSAEVYRALRQASGDRIAIVEVSADQLSLQDAVSTYLFNSQIVTSDQGQTVLVAPAQCREHPRTRRLIEDLVAAGTFAQVQYVDVGQSMSNGGGPACLRLRVVLSPQQQSATAPGVWWTGRLAEQLRHWVQRHYRDTLTADDLADVSLLEQSRTALDELTQILGLGSVYDFQQA